MKYKIKDLNYLRQDNAITNLLQDNIFERNEITKILKGISNRDKVTQDTLFTWVDTTCLDELEYQYCLIENELGMFLIREDNLIEVEELEDKKYNLGIDKIIKVGNKTIMIDLYGDKVITERDNFDKDDVAKALMICILKRDGYNINNIYSVAESVKPTKAIKKSKPTV